MKGFRNAGPIVAGLLISLGGLAAEGTASGLLTGDGRRDLLVRMERAERGPGPEAWDRLWTEDFAAFPRWENGNLLGEFETRFGRWLERKWQAGIPDPRVGDLLREIDRANLAYIVETDGEGRVLRDERGDPVFKGPENFFGDDEERRGHLESKMEELISSWERDAAAEYQELLSVFSGPLKEVAERKLSAAAAEQRRAVRNEFERFILQGQSRFLAARLKDSFSLRRKSEENTAGETVRRLAGEAEKALAEAKESLSAALIASADEEPEKILLRSENWQEDFKREFERGIGEWSRGEERLFAERIRWETTAQREFVSAEAAWDSAFSEFARVRNGWITEMEGLLEKGRLAWDRSEKDFLADYGRVMRDYAAAARAELEQFREETAGLLEVYRRSLALTETAEENGLFLDAEARRLGECKNVLDGEIALREAVAGEYRDRINGLITDYFVVWTLETVSEADGSYTDNIPTREGRKLLDHFEVRLDDYLVLSDECQRAMMEQYNEVKRHGAAIGEMESAAAEILKNEIAPRREERDDLALRRIPELLSDLAFWTGPGGVRDRFEASRIEAAEKLLALEADIRSYGVEGVGTGPLDREIERMRTELALKNRQVEIARAVLDYARDVSSNRPTEAQTRETLRDAEIKFAEAEAEYRRRLDTLDGHVAGTLKAARENTVAAGDLLSAASADLEAARRAYEDALSVYRSNDVSILRSIIEGYEEELSRYHGDGPGSRAGDRKNYAVVEEGFTRESLSARRMEIIRDIEGTSDFDDFTDLSELRGRAAALDGDARREAELLVYRSEMILEVLRGEPLSAAEGEAFLAGLSGGGLPEEVVLRRVWEDFGRFSPVLEAMYRTRDAGSVRTLVAEADLSSRDGILDFSRALAALEGLPSYLTEALGRWVSVKARALGLELPAPGPSGPETDYGALYLLETDPEVSREIAGLLAREGAEKRNAAWLAAAATFVSPGDRLAEDAAAWRAIVEGALEVFSRAGTPPAATAEDVKRFRRTILAGERNVLRLDEAKRTLEGDLEILSKDREAYKTGVLEAKRTLMNEAGDRLAEARRLYDRALEDFESASKNYGVFKRAAGEAGISYEDRRHELRRAEEIRDYAVGGYTPTGRLEAVLEKHAVEAERIRVVLDLLESVQRAEGLPFADRMDGDYGAAKESERIRKEALHYLLLGEEEITREAAEVRKNIQTAVSGMRDAAAKVFIPGRIGEDGVREPLFFILDGEASGTLTDFRYAGEGAFAEAVGIYLSGDRDEAARRMSADCARWINGLAVYGPEGSADLLREFGLAYYYDAVVQKDLAVEGAPAVSAGLLGNMSWQKLVDDYAGLGPYSAPLFGPDGEIVGYETLYPDERRTVEDFLADTTRNIYERLRADADLDGLYSFYKMMIASNNLAGGTSSIGKDLGDLVFDHVDAPAERRQDRCLAWWRVWTHQEGRRIRALREDIEAARETGEPERRAAADALAAFYSADADRRINLDRLGGLLGGADSLTMEGFLEVLKEKTRREPGAELVRVTEVLFPGLSAAQRQNALTVLAAVKEGLRLRADHSRRAAEAAAEVLQSERMDLYGEYRRLLDGGSLDEFSLRRLVEGLYKNPAFTPEDHWDYTLHIEKTISAETRSGYGEKLASLGEGLVNLLKGRLDAAGAAEEERIAGAFRALRSRRGEWDLKIRELLETGSDEWQAGAVRFYGMRKRWREDFSAEYEEKNRLWDMKYLLFTVNREDWIRTGAERAVTAGAEGMAREFGLNRERLISEVERVRIPDMPSGLQDPGRMISRALNGKTLETLFAQAARLSDKPGEERPLVAARLPAVRNGTAALRHAEDFARGIGDEIYRRAALAAAIEMAKAVEETEKGITDTVLSANRSVEKNLVDTLRSAGYQHSGGIYSRRAVIDETLLGGIERETQEIEGYRYFRAPEFRHGTDLSREGLEGRSGDHIGGLIRLAQKNLSKYLELIFGREESKKKDWTWAGTEGVRDLFENARLAYEASAGYGRMKDGEFENRGDGLFNWHVGYLPVMDPKEAEKVKEAGYGELGRIMALFLKNEARLGRGLASFDVAWYSKKLWDDDKNNDGKSDGLFAAPTVRSLTNIAVSVAATGTGNLWLAAAVNMMDDAAFTMMDAAAGRTSFAAGLTGLAKQAGTGAATLGIGAGMGALGNSLGAFGDDMLGKTLLKGTELFALNAAAGGINAAGIGKNGLVFDGTAFRRGVLGSDALSALAGGTAAAFLEGSFEGLGRRDIADVRSFAGFSGSLLQTGLGYALSGEAKLNIADFSIFGMESGGRVLSGGLLDITLGGKGPLFEIGNSGTDVSFGRIMSALSGMETWKNNMRIELADRFGTKDFAEGYGGVRSAGTAMRSLLSFGDEAGRVLLEDLLSGTKNLRVGYTAGRGETDGRDLHLASLGSRQDIHSRLAAGTVLQHEAYRDGVRVGEIQADGTVETRASNFEELKAASIARLRMAAGVDGDYGGFLSGNKDLLFETFLYAKARETGGEDLFLNYLAETYRNGEDFYFPEVTTKGEYQNREEYRRYPLLASRTEETVRAINAERMEGAVDGYIQDIANQKGYLDSLDDFILPPGVTREKLAEEISSRPDLQEQFKYSPVKFESIASSGCMMMAAMYGAETLSGLDLSAPEVNKMLKEAGLYAGDSDLSARLLGKAMELLTKGEYRFELLDLGGLSPDAELLKNLSESPDSYLAHLRIKRGGVGDAYHSEMLSSIDWETYYLPGSAPGARGVHTANPWGGGGYTGRTYRSLGEIARWDVYKADPTWRYYFNRNSDWEIARN